MSKGSDPNQLNHPDRPVLPDAIMKSPTTTVTAPAITNNFPASENTAWIFFKSC